MWANNQNTHSHIHTLYSRLLSAADNITLDAVNVDLVCNSDDLSDLKKGVREHAPLIWKLGAAKHLQPESAAE